MKAIVSIILVVVVSVSSKGQTPRITFKAPTAYPEGIAYDARNKLFYVSSVTTGTIGTVDEKGNYSIVLEDHALKSTFGMKVDEKNNLLWVCTGDPLYSKYRDSSTYKKMARVIAIDLSTGKKVKDIDLANLVAGKHFPNDLTLDNKGNIYITDSFSPAIYKIDPKGVASVFLQSDKFKSKQVGLNGLVFHPDGYLLVAHNTQGALYKIEVKDPQKMERVKMTTFFPGADGLLLDNDRNLLLVQNKGVNKVFQLISNDQWRTANVKSATGLEDRFQNPTTIAMKDGKPFILNAKINELSDSTMAPSDEFSIQEAILKPVPAEAGEAKSPNQGKVRDKQP